MRTPAPKTVTSTREAGTDALQRGPHQAEGSGAAKFDSDKERRPELVVDALAQACIRKESQDGVEALSETERIILTVTTLERELRDGGFEQWFTNAEDWSIAFAVEALRRIGCFRVAEITQQAIEALGADVPLTSSGIARALRAENAERDTTLSVCDDVFYAATEPMAARLIGYIERERPTAAS